MEQELIEKQARFWVQMSQGSTLQAACDDVGVNRATGRRWRQATGGQVPRKKPEPSGRYLSLPERLQIADLHLAGAGVRAIAAQIGRCPSTVSRELRRNSPVSTGRAKYALGRLGTRPLTGRAPAPTNSEGFSEPNPATASRRRSPV